METRSSGEVVRLIALALVVLLEGAATLSVVLHSAFLPIGALYANIISVVVFVLPVVVGLLCQRFEAAIFFAVLPVWVFAIVYLALFAPIWNVDIFTLSVQAGRTAGATALVGGLGFFGWLIRRVFFTRTAPSASSAAAASSVPAEQMARRG